MTTRWMPFAASILLTLPSVDASAQARISFTGAGITPIPLDGAQPIAIAADGSLQASCALQPGTSACQGITGEGPGLVPTGAISVSLTPDAQGRYPVTTGQQIQVLRTISAGAEVCLATATSESGVSGWETLVAPNGSSTATVSFANAGEATLGFRCYSAAGASPSTAQLRFAVSGTSGGGCSLPPHPHIRPSGLVEYAMTWNQVFDRNYPNGPGYLTPLGSFTPQRSMNGPLSAKMYLAISFTAQAGVRGNIAFAPSQPIYAIGYTEYRPGTAFVSVSPCAGDFRPHDPSSTDMFLRNCRLTPHEGGFFFGNSPTPSSSYCQLTPGQTYYLNVVMGPPGGLNGFTNSCNSGLQRCEVNAQPRGN